MKSDNKLRNLFCIRTQADLCKNDQELKEVLGRDLKLLTKWNIKIDVYATSAEKGMAYFDNEKVRELMDS